MVSGVRRQTLSGCVWSSVVFFSVCAAVQVFEVPVFKESEVEPPRETLPPPDNPLPPLTLSAELASVPFEIEPAGRDTAPRSEERRVGQWFRAPSTTTLAQGVVVATQ